MSNTEKHNKSIARAVWKGFEKNTDGVLTVPLVQVLVRAVAISPLDRTSVV